MKGPYRVNDRISELDISGHVFPFFEGVPVLAAMPGTPDLFLLIFSTSDKLRQTMRDYALPYDRIMQVEEPHDFVEWVMFSGQMPRIRIAVDAIKVGNVCRFREITVPRA